MSSEDMSSGAGSRRIFDWFQRRLPLVHFIADASVWVLAIPLAVLLRYDFRDDSIFRHEVAEAVVVAVVLQGILGLIFGVYRRRWRYGGFEEMRVVALTTISVGVLATLLWWGVESELRVVPRSVSILAAGTAFLAQIALRSIWRLHSEYRKRPVSEDLERLVVVGAGDAAEQVLRTLRTTSDTGFVPVALVDDDWGKRNLRMWGVRVEGTVDQLVEVASRCEATAVLVAAPSADAAFLRRVNADAGSAGLRMFTLPPVDQLFGTVSAADIRPINPHDLLGRSPADIDTDAVAHYITGKRVLVTGAGGSIGSELCRQLAKFEPAALVMLDRDESGLHGTELSIHGRALLDDPHLVLADIRDARRLDEVFATHRPQVVFHAAALKHQPLLEMYPGEGWKTNVVGTQLLLEAAARHGTERFVNVSTDKAANPTNVLGWTKRITERLTAHAAAVSNMETVSVRFGNVLGSSGSVLRSFAQQVALGGPITVTHPEVTRYFMTVSEAARLTVYAGAIGSPGEVLILDMGQPVRIADVAERFARQQDPPLEIVFTGLRPNEKLHEHLVADGEVGECRVHELVLHVTVPPLAPMPTMYNGCVPSCHEMQAIALGVRGTVTR
jgi:FlaA1/EpsC-like NDP-sugar epimerase